MTAVTYDSATRTGFLAGDIVRVLAEDGQLAEVVKQAISEAGYELSAPPVIVIAPHELGVNPIPWSASFQGVPR